MSFVGPGHGVDDRSRAGGIDVGRSVRAVVDYGEGPPGLPTVYTVRVLLAVAVKRIEVAAVVVGHAPRALVAGHSVCRSAKGGRSTSH